MSVGSLIEQLLALPADYEMVICDGQGQDWPILAVSDGGEERAVIIDVGTQDDLAVTEEWPLGWKRVEV